MEDGKITLKEYYEYTAHQINREDELIHKRITWFLTFEGFLFASLALLAKPAELDENLYSAIKDVIPVLGISVGILAFLSVQAALSAISDLKMEWWKKSKGIEEAVFPRPCGKVGPHILGSSYGRFLPILVIGSWIYIYYKVCS